MRVDKKEKLLFEENNKLGKIEEKIKKYSFEIYHQVFKEDNLNWTSATIISTIQFA